MAQAPLSDAYEAGGAADRTPLLLLPGFGVGTFYFDQQIEELSKEYKIYAMDFLGQEELAD